MLHKRLSVHTTGGRWGVDGGVVRGMSGSPALDPETGRVCGMIKAHAWAAVDGGYPVPAGGWLIPFSPVHVPASWFERNAAANPVGNRWRRIAAGADDIQRALFEPDDAPGEITPANLLDPECGFAPFEPVAEFEELLRWCRSAENPLVRLVSGASGAGKSRIAVELCRRLRDEGWVAGFLGPRLDDRWRETFARAVRHELQVCVVVDDAEHRGEEIAAILHEARAVIAVMREHGLRPTVRVVLLSRNDPSRFETDLLAIDVIGDGFGRWIQSVLGTPVRLPPVLPDQEAVFRRAWHAYASRLGVPARAQPRWRHDLPGITTLEVYALAADAVLNVYFDDARDGRLSDDPLGAIRRHHLRYWAQKLKRADYRLRRRTQAAARARPEAGSKSVEIPLDVAEAWLLVPTLAAAADRSHLRQVMRTVAKILGHPGRDELKTLYRLYPKQDAGPPSPDGRRPKPLPAVLTPDRLAELMFREVCRSLGEVRLRDFLAAVLWLAAGTRPAGLPDDGRYAHPALRLIGRARTGGAAERDDPVYAKIDQALSALLAAHPRELLPALVKVAGEIPRAEPLVRLLGVAAQNCDQAVLPLVEPCLPDDGRGLSPVALTVLQRRVDAAQGSDDQAVADRVSLWRRMSLHLYHLDRHDGALRTNLDAINECRVLRHRGGGYARASAELFARLHGDRALFLLERMLSGRQPDGEIGEALTYGEEAVRAYRDLGADYELALAGVLHNQNVLYARAGRLHQALAAGRKRSPSTARPGPAGRGRRRTCTSPRTSPIWAGYLRRWRRRPRVWPCSVSCSSRRRRRTPRT
ncbi:hypothetical protein ACFQY4_26695 [Catellatospora bangladeshensis]|uniref:hypothetical protein n=1 Tax=Catellatospora bangladeshensis TaxID=310355 RepID=UPI00361CBFDB